MGGRQTGFVICVHYFQSNIFLMLNSNGIFVHMSQSSSDVYEIPDGNQVGGPRAAAP